MTACDIGFLEDAAAACMGSSEADMTPSPTGLMHASGLVRDALISNQNLTGIRAVLGPKVSGAQTLTGVLGQKPLGFTTLFSSVAGLLGSAGQGSYAAANAIMDSMASELSLQVSLCQSASCSLFLQVTLRTWCHYPYGHRCCMSNAIPVHFHMNTNQTMHAKPWTEQLAHILQSY